MLPKFSTSSTDGGEWSALHTVRFTLSCLDPRVGLDAMKKKTFPLPEIEPPSSRSQPAAIPAELRANTSERDYEIQRIFCFSHR